MAFFAVPYTVFFEDTMAYGSHHFLTNFRFQCVVRETLIFDHLARIDPSARAELAGLVMLTREGYTRNYAPAALGQRVAILLSFCDQSHASMRLCVRTIREDGEPVAAGFQTVVFTARDGSLAPVPRFLDAFAASNHDLCEKGASPPYAEAVVGGRSAKHLFPDEVRAFAAEVCRGDGGRVVGRRPETAPLTGLPGTTVLAFPGQGSFDGALLRGLVADDHGATALARADGVAATMLRGSFSEFARGDAATQAAMAAAEPDLDQFGIFLTGVLMAARVVREGAPIGAVVGHSFGEIAALTAAGALDLDEALAVVAARVRVLRNAGSPSGGMMAAICPDGKAEELLDGPARAAGCRVAVVNHPEQCVVSGPRAELERLRALFTAAGVSTTLLGARQPFHSPLLGAAARIMADGLVAIEGRPPALPAYSPILNGFYAPGPALGPLLASHLARPLDFPAAAIALRDAGARRFVECGGGGVLSKLVGRLLGSDAVATANDTSAEGVAKTPEPRRPVVGARAAPETRPSSDDAARGAPGPVAIVAMGAIVPGAADIDTFWRNLVDGVGAIRDLREVDAHFAADLMADGISPDKTYSPLSGHVEAAIVPTGSPEAMSKCERLLETALDQAGRWRRRDGARIGCFLGATGDGIAEYDEALLQRGVAAVASALDLPDGVDRAAMDGASRDLPGWFDGVDPETLGSHPSLRRVVDRKLGAAVPLILLDAACASSLYAVDLGMRLLHDGQIDVAYVGGAFAPGAANSALFAQFGGLSATGCRPFDAAADGVVFGEGAAVLVLKRLGDAVADGDRIHAVVRGVGLSSDGRSPSVNVPRVSGQSLGVRNAYVAGLDPATVQYVEAHATATPVGDATEFSSLSAIFGAARRADGPIILGSVKSLVGHTGWLAGVTSVIKVCLAMAARRLPAQLGFDAAHPRIDLAGSPFAIPTTPWDWPSNLGGLPRRAAVNGFGFGGTNAHVVLDEHVPVREVAAWDGASSTVSGAPASHGVPAGMPARPSAPSGGDEVVVVAVGCAFATGAPRWSSTPGERASRIPASAMRVPDGRRMMPDVTEQMDVAQFLALAAADEAFAGLSDLGKERGRMGVVLGAAGKARRGIAANERVFADRMERLLAEALTARDVSAGAARAAAGLVAAELKSRNAPSNAYTLVGMMPNIVTGRVANLYDLMGANMVVDAGGRSLLEALRVSARVLHGGACDAVLAGAVNATSAWPLGPDQPGAAGSSPDGAVGMVLATRSVAVRRGLPILATLRVGVLGDDHVLVEPVAAPAGATTTKLGSGRPHEVVGIDALAVALRSGAATRLEWIASAADAGGAVDAIERPGDVRYAATTLVPVPLPASSAPDAGSPGGVAAGSAMDGPVAYLTDDERLARAFHAAAGLRGEPLLVVPPADIHPSPDEGSLARTMTAVRGCALVVVLRDLSATPHDSLLRDGRGERFAEHCFAAFQAAYDGVSFDVTGFLGVSLGAVVEGRMHPEAAMLAAFLKSMARELPSARIRSLATADAAPGPAARQAMAELSACGLARDVDVAIAADGVRHVVRLGEFDLERDPRAPGLGPSSHVLLTGGGRGITALMAEALVARYGCRLTLFGRSDPGRAPPEVARMDAAAFAAHEAEFYRRRRLADPSARMPDLKKDWARLGADRELAANLARLSAMTKVSYRQVDVTDGRELDAAVAEAAAANGGRIDLVVHGAGVQFSKRLPRRTLAEWRATVATKVTGLRNLRAACAAHCAALPGFHLVTSAMAPVGNDGQADYGAANAALGALASALDGGAAGPRWSALGWIGWDDVGMSGGPEIAAILRSRGLRSLGAGEGKGLFLSYLEGASERPDAVLFTQGERDFFSLDLAPPFRGERRRGGAAAPLEWRLDASAAPYLSHHLFKGTPTLPGAFEIDFAVRAALAAMPGSAHARVDLVEFRKMVRVPFGRSVVLRAPTMVVDAGPASTTVRVRVVSDFLHPDGRVLQHDVLHAEATVEVAAAPFAPVAPDISVDWAGGSPIVDNYVRERSPLTLSSAFDCLRGIRGGPAVRTATVEFPPGGFLGAMAGFAAPSVLLDAMLRLGNMVPPSGEDDLHVPEMLRDVRFTDGLNDIALARDGRPLRLIAATPRLDGEKTVGAWCVAIDGDGCVVASIGAGRGTRVGTVVPHAAAAE